MVGLESVPNISAERDNLRDKAAQYQAVREAELGVQRAYKKIVSLTAIPPSLSRAIESLLLEGLVILNDARSTEFSEYTNCPVENPVRTFDTMLPLAPSNKALVPNNPTRGDDEESEAQSDESEEDSDDEESDTGLEESESESFDEF